MASGCESCHASSLCNQRKQGLLKRLPIPEKLFDRVIADVFEWGQIQATFLHTKMAFDSFLLNQEFNGGYIRVLPYCTKHLTSEMATK